VSTPSVNEELLENFLLDAWEALNNYDQATLGFANQLNETNLKDLRVVSHRIKGTAALYGYKQISQLAEMVERLLSSDIPAAAHDDLSTFLEQVGVILRSALEHLADSGREHDLGLELAHMGGTEMLSNLLKRHPQAFVRAPDPEEQATANAPTSLTEQAKAFKAANEDIWDYFPLEASEHIAAMRDALDSLSSGQDHNESVTALFRAAHTLKGSAYMVDFAMMGDFAHELEDLMDMVREGELTLDGEVMSLLRHGVDIIEAMLAAAEGLPNRLEKDLPKVHAQLARTLGKPLEDDGTRDGTDDTSADTQSTRTSLCQSLQTFKAANEDIWEYFPLEVIEHTAAMRDALALTRADESEAKADSDSVTRLFRATHTLKGSAYMVELKLMGDFAHELEDLMDMVRKGERPLNDDVRGVLQQGIHVLEQMIQAADGDNIPLDESMQNAEAKLANALGREVKHSQRSDDSGQLTSNLRIFFQENQDVWEYFAPEAREHIESMRNALIVAQGVVAQGHNILDSDSITSLFRAAHTLKGSAYMVGFNELGEFAHKLEELMSAVRDGVLTFNSDVQDTLMGGMQVLEQMLRAAEGEGTGLEVVLFDTESQLANLLGLETPDRADAPQVTNQTDTPQTASKPGVTATIRVSLDKLDALMNLAGDMVMARSRLLRRLNQLEGIIKLLNASHERMTRVASDFEERYINPRFNQDGQVSATSAASRLPATNLTPNLATNTQVASDGSSTHSATSTPEHHEHLEHAEDGFKASVSGLFDELEFDTYDDLNILARTIGEMTSDITEIQTQFNQISRGLRGEADAIQGITRDLRQQISRSRMVPIGRVFSRLTRLVNQAPLDKSYRLEFAGETVEVDNVIVETIIDPLLHLVRNSFYHGIEPMTERISTGKHAEGVVTVRAFYQGNDVFIEVEDDGRGINVAAVKRKAIENGLGQAENIRALDDKQAVQLIFAPGLSTAEQVSTEAGRGVGMDAVAESIHHLNGDITVSSTPGKGSRFTIRLPLTLITSEALLVQIGTYRFALPVDNVRSLQRVSAGQLFRMQSSETLSLALTMQTDSGEHEYFIFENQPIRVYRLKNLLGISQEREKDILNAIILDVGGERFAAIVDDYNTIEEIVVRGLSEQLQNLFYLSGVTVSSSGELLLILDPSSFDKLSRYQSTDASSTLALEEVEAKHVLLVDDSISVRRVCGRMLERGGFEVSTAVDGQEAIDRIQRGERFDVILTDLEMPRANGYEVIEHVRRTAGAEHTPIVMMTTRAGAKHSQLAFDLGASDYLSKPVDEHQLVQTMKGLMT